MFHSRKSLWLLSAAVLLAIPRWSQGAGDAPVNLLGLPGATLEESTAPRGDWEKALTDNNPATVALANASPDAPLDVVFGFAGKIVTPEQVRIHLPGAVPADAAVPQRFEILVSTLSSHAGFQSLRADPLKPTPNPQTFSFPPTAARWIMLRFIPGGKAKRVAVADVAVLGHEGPPVTRYAFKEAPAKAFDVLAKLKAASSLNVTIPDDEAELFQDVKDGQFNKWSFAEAALLESGVHDAAKRKAYLQKIDALETQARQAIAGARTPFEKGEKLLHWLHTGPLAKGYQAKQTDLSTILDDHTFNCVSSATMFNVLGRRLDLDARAIEVPEHAFAILYDGTRHADVETTTASGFNPARDPAAQKEFEKTTGFRYIPDSHRDQRREVREAGLVAIIAYNHGVQLGQEKRYHEALLAYFRAMSLDSEFDSAVKNALSVLANWSVELSRDKKFSEAVQVLATGLELAPKDATLVNNHKVVWGEWAEATMKAGQEDEALALVRKAAAAIPGEAKHFQAMQAWLYIRPGEEAAKVGEWDKALAVVEPGLQKLDTGPREELRHWRAGLYLRWGNALAAKDQFAAAVDALDKGLMTEPKDKHLANNLVYTVQEWAWKTYSREGSEPGKAIIVRMQERFPKLPGLNELAKNHVHRVVNDLIQAGNFSDALAAVDSHKDLIHDAADVTKLSVAVFDSWAGKHWQAKEWDKAVDVYEQGLTQLPKDSHLKNNLVFTIQEWAKDTYAAGRADKVKDMLLAQLKRFPQLPEVKEVAKNHVGRTVQDLVAKQEYSDALAAIDDQADLLPKKDDAKALAYPAYDAWANGMVKKKDWQGATDIYAKALKRFPKDAHLTNNAVFTWDSWAKTYFEGKDWAAAAKVYEKALKQFPANGTLKTNLNFCKQQMKN
jgi:tetratricopeptide (TPR) repeat protein